MRTPATTWSNARPRLRRDVHLAALRSIVRAFGNWWAVRRSERELHALDDRTLADIGLSRWEIRSVVRQGPRAPRSRPVLF